MAANPFRDVPAVNDLLATARLRALTEQHPHELLLASVRSELQELRQHIKDGTATPEMRTLDSLASRVAGRLERELQPKLRRVINATGIVLHTNLGRAPMALAAARAAYEAAHGYLNLELELATGKRSSRQNAIREWVCRLTGAESATVVNNNAAATVIALRAIAQGKEVIVSRGQLIEIGGSFRIPDIMGVSGATLREVGTTNITRLSDYEKALGPNTGALLQIHSSNYRISGFTKSVALEDLVALGKKHGLPVLDDVGSGALLDFAQFGFKDEPVVSASIARGADLVLFSGDKLLGGPQAGILAGKKTLIQKIEKDPLMRAFRCDKMTLAALEATLRIYLDAQRALQEIPTLRLLAAPLAELQQRAESLAERIRTLPGVASVQVRKDHAFVGGGSLPDQSMPTWVVALASAHGSDSDLAQRLRLGTPAVMGRLQRGELLLDVRTVFSDQEDLLVQALGTALATPADSANGAAPSA